jgi:hypothetical protein
MGRSILGQNKIFTLIGVNLSKEDGPWITVCGEDDSVEHWNTFLEVYPILKDFRELLNPVLIGDRKISPIKYIYGFNIDDEFLLDDSETTISNDYDSISEDFSYVDYNIDCWMSTYSIIEKLLGAGFGAIRNDDSHTGWVDPSGYPCLNYREVMNRSSH